MLNLNPRCPTRRLLLTSLASAAGLLVLPGCAGAARAAAGLATVEVYDRDSGRVLPVHPHDGRRYVPGNPGARYALRLRNLSIGRVLVVLSVDGINVISGARAAWNQVGYVLEPGRVYDINGWRKSDTEVAAFEFAPIERSYAARTGRPDDVGVIGLAVFRERPLPPPPPVLSAPEVTRSERQAAPAARGQAANAAREKSLDDSASSRLGTGHGQREWSLSRRTDFERASSTPDQLTRLEYDSLDRLIAAGVVPAPQGRGWPSPFPANASGYAPDPPRW
jgi:hypothetical protein